MCVYVCVWVCWFRVCTEIERWSGVGAESGVGSTGRGVVWGDRRSRDKRRAGPHVVDMPHTHKNTHTHTHDTHALILLIRTHTHAHTLTYTHRDTMQTATKLPCNHMFHRCQHKPPPRCATVAAAAATTLICAYNCSYATFPVAHTATRAHTHTQHTTVHAYGSGFCIRYHCSSCP